MLEKITIYEIKTLKKSTGLNITPINFLFAFPHKAVKCYRKALTYYNDIPTNRECSSAEEYKELLQLMEERLRVMRQVANIFRRISNLIQCGQIAV